MNIKVNFFSIVRRFGISKKTNKPYDITQLSYQQPLERGEFGPMTVEGFGSNLVEMMVNESCIKECANFEPLQQVELTLEPDPRDINRNIVTSIKATETFKVNNNRKAV